MFEKITPLILTFNEAPNIERVVQQLGWAKRIVVIDSWSSDETVSTLKDYPQVEVFQRSFETFAGQCNYGLQKITSEWVLSLDADYFLTDELISEIESLEPNNAVSAYAVKFKYCIFGKPLRGALYPPRKVLYRRERAIYKDDGHAHHVKVEGETAWLSSFIHHDDRKSLSRWLSSQDRYMIQEVEKFRQMSNEQLGAVDFMRRSKVLAPFVLFFYCLFIQRGILDGWAGWYYALQRMLAEILLALRLIEEDQHQLTPINQYKKTEEIDRINRILQD